MTYRATVEVPSEPRIFSDKRGENPVMLAIHNLAVTAALGTAARLGVFDAVAEGPVSLSLLAQQTSTQPQSLRPILDILVGERLLNYRAKRYALSVEGHGWLHPDSPHCITTVLPWMLDLLKWWGGLYEAMTGAEEYRPYLQGAKQDWLRTVRAEYETSRLHADEVADALALPRTARSVIDVGGGSGWYSAVLCRRNPQLRATVIDEAQSVEIAREIMWETGMDEVVTHEVGDIFTADLGGPHDAALCLSVLNGVPETKVVGLLRRIRASLHPGGVIALMRVERPDADVAQSQAAAAMELFLRLLSGLDAASPQELSAQLTAAGFAPPCVVKLGSPYLRLVVARAL